MGGPIAALEDGDLITIDLNAGTLDVTGVAGRTRTADEIEAVLDERLSRLNPWRPPARSGLLGLYTRLAAPAQEGAGIHLD